MVFRRMASQDKVEVLPSQMPIRIVEGGTCIQFGRATKDNVMRTTLAMERQSVETELREIGTVIFCTGYDFHETMLEGPLQRPKKASTLEMEQIFQPPTSSSSSSSHIHRMSENFMTKYLGDIPIATENICIPPDSDVGLFRGTALLSNPDMFFLTSDWCHQPLLGAELRAWLVMGCVTGRVRFRTHEEMIAIRREEFLEELDDPVGRYYFDKGYQKAWDTLGRDHCTNQKWGEHKEVEVRDHSHYTSQYLLLAGIARDAKYPVDFGTRQKTEQNRKANTG